MKRLAWSVLLLLPGVALAQAEGGDAPLSAEPIPLSIGVPVTTEQSANESVSYLFVADPGRTYLFELEQQVLDFVVSVETPSGEIRTFWSPLFRDESEYVLLETIDGGPYRINVESQDLSNARGRHTITASSLDADTSGSQYVEAWRLMSDAAAANSEGSSSQAVLDRYERAARLWRELGEVRMETQSLYCAAWVRYWQLGDAEGAAAQASAVAERYARLERPSLEANAILLQATALMRAAQLAGEDGGPIFDQALEAFRKSYAMHDALENLAGLAAVENQLGLAYFNRGDIARGDYREAAAHLGNAEQLLSDLGDWRDALNARHNLALIDLDQGYAAEAARELEAILPAIPEGVDRRFRGIVLTNLGFAHQFAGRFDAALRAFSDALSILRTEERSEAWVGHALRGLGSTYHAVGEHERAMGFLRQALDKASNDGRIRASILATLGNVTYLTADFAAALDLHEQSVHSTTSTDARTYREVLVVRDLVALDRFDEAIRMAGELLSGSDMSDVTRADLSIELGHAYLGLDDVDSSIELFELAFGVHDALGLRAGQARSLHGLALAARAGGDLQGAARYGEEALRRIESLRTNVTAPDLRAFYTAAQREYYESQIDVLMSTYLSDATADAAALPAALAVSERARARMTAELLAEASIGLTRDLPGAVVERRRELLENLNAIRYRRDRLLESAGAEPRQLGELASRVAEIENELSVIDTDIRASNTARASLAIPDALTAEEIQTMLDERTALLQFALGDRRSYVWVVTNDAVQGVELAGGATVEAVARRAYEDLQTPQARASGRRDDSLAMLSDLIIAPVAPLLGAKERLIVAADGALHYVPFGVLPIVRNGMEQRLLEAFELTNVPSMSVVAAQRSQQRRQNPSGMVAVFADPVFTLTDARFSIDPTANVSATSSETSPLGLLPERELARLPASGAEARAIARLVPENRRFIATAFDASRESVMSRQLSRYRTVHFATHGLVDSQFPALSELVLSRFDAEGRPRNGSLRLQDIYGLDLDADLVVLSGCETALGRQIRGEGLVGFVQGFLYAGARNLVVSLWQVPDAATAELMARFYEYSIHENLRPADALRRAQLSIAAERRWSDPYFWGAFIVIGEE